MMGLFALLAAAASVILGVFTVEPNTVGFVRSLIELGGVLGVFALICAAEAAN